MSPTPDPFGTAALRDAGLRAWRDSPTRFTEDANAEEDLRLGGYSDRLFVELAQNAADAAALAGVPGKLKVTVVEGEVRVANTGAPLDAAGVAALASLRASAKRGGVTVGRFGVGFAAVLAVSSEPRVVSRSGGVRFSASGTRAAVADLPGVNAQLERREGAVPVLRLPWPIEAGEPDVPEGFDTEVRLPLKEGADQKALLAEIAAEVDDVLLTLPVFESIEVAGTVWTRAVTPEGVVQIARDGAAARRWLVHADSGEFTPEQAATLGIEAAKHPRWTVLWALPIDADGVPEPLEADVLHAPTPTDERLGLPARLIAAAPIEPSRRRVLGGPAVDAVLHAAARAYPELVRLVLPEHRLALVPSAGFPLSEVDSTLRELIDTALRDGAWIAAAAGGPELPGARARVLEADSAALVELLADAVADLAAAPLAGARAARTLAGVGAHPVSVADAVDALAGLERPPRWWCALYAALAELLDAHQVNADELAGLSVPLVDGGVLPGARGVLLPAFEAGDLLELVGGAGIVGLRVARPDVVHPLLERLGATTVDAAALLDAPAVRAAVERSGPDAESGLDTTGLADLVLRLVSETGGADPERSWLGALALRSGDGDVRRADELVLPGAPLLEVLDPDAVGVDGALALLDADFARRWPAGVLAGVRVLQDFAVVLDADPGGPDHDLPDEERWWESREPPPARVHAVRDLDLVADDAWPAAIGLLAGQPETWRALSEPGGHTGWWLARYAELDGAPPRHWRLPECTELAGLYEPVPDLGLRPELLAAIGVRAKLVVADLNDAADLLERLADPAREPSAGVVLRAHSALAALSASPELDLSALDPPSVVRALNGAVVDADRAAVLDAPWLLEVADHGVLVACAGVLDDGAPAALAELLDLPLAGEVIVGDVVSDGEVARWSELAAVRAAIELLGGELPEGGVCLHPELEVRANGEEHKVRWWVSEGVVHAADTVEGLARAFAHVVNRWNERHLIAELLSDPQGATLLG